MMDYRFAVKRFIKSVANPVLDVCGVYDTLLARRVFAQPGWLILMYHRVIRDRKEDPFRLGMCIDEKRFAEQIAYFATQFTPITMGEAVARIRAGKPLPRNAVSITFDDGYLDFKDIALPIMKRHGCPSTVFVTTGGVEEREPFWWDRVTEAVALTKCREIDVAFLARGAAPLSLAPMRRRQSLERLMQLLWEQPPGALYACVEQVRERLQVTAASGSLPAPRMRHDDIRAIARDDVELGAHCEQHFDMRRLSEDECLHELNASRATLQDIGGQPVSGFAYPGGRQNASVRKLVARAGFSYAAATTRGLNRPPHDMFSLRRLGAPDDGVPDLKRCIVNIAGSAPEPLGFESVPWP